MERRTIAKFLSVVQIDQVLTAVSGCVSLSAAFHCYRSTLAHKFTNFTVHENGHDTIQICTLLITLVGAINIFIAAARFNGYCRFNFNKYIFSLVTTLMCNFALGILLTDFRGQLSDTLGGTMTPKLQHSIVSQMSLGVGYAQSDSWDFLQVHMRCCGVEGYQDYIQKKVTAKNQPLPMSCCVMKTKHTGDRSPVAENPSQCMLDATHKATQSVFLHVQGCRSPLSRWLSWHVSKMTAMLFAAICIQAVTLLYMSWVGFQRPLDLRR